MYLQIFLGPFWVGLVVSCSFLAWLLFTPACLRSRLCLRFRPALLPVSCCRVSSFFWSVYRLLPVSWRGVWRFSLCPALLGDFQPRCLALVPAEP